MSTPDFDARAREIAFAPSWNYPEQGGIVIEHGFLADLISAALSKAFEEGKMEGLLTALKAVKDEGE